VSAAQRRQPARLPAGHVLAGDAEGEGDLGLRSGQRQTAPGLHADTLERLAVAQPAGVVAVGGWFMPPCCQPNPDMSSERAKRLNPTTQAPSNPEQLNEMLGATLPRGACGGQPEVGFA
jgi:hypothetical protein